MEEDRVPELSTEVHRRDDVAVVVVRGEIDMSTAPEFRRAVNGALDEVGRVEVDLRHVRFMDSSGLAVLVEAYHRLGPDHDAIVVRDPQPMVRRVLSLAGIDGLLEVRDGDGPTADVS